MLFNSVDFAIFLPVVFVLYWFVTHKNLKLQNLLIVAASYFFYGWWDWRFLGLILFSTVLDYGIGIALARQTNTQKRKLLLTSSLLVNLGFLGFFKYYDFFLDNFVAAFSFFGQDMSPERLEILLPVGISFYTFQTLSYTIDVYKNKLTPTKNFIAFAAFVSFFPQLVAGPIERATNLLPQFYQKRKFDYLLAKDGLRQILWGLTKKIVIADNAAYYANLIFNDHESYSGSTLLMGAFFFAFQIYGDFSGYSDVAIGTSRLFGFNLMQNFAFPYFSRDIAEFWRRWHISLSTWFRDYLYIPLGGSRGGLEMKIRNTMIIFVVSGFWHGANWTYIIWGALNAIYFLPLMLLDRNRIHTDVVAKGKYLPGIREMFQMLLTFFITLIAWVFFRAKDVTTAIDYIIQMFSSNFISIPTVLPMKVLAFIGLLLIVEWLQRTKQHGLEFKTNTKVPWFARWILYFGLISLIILFSGEQQQFIYFQF
ncbi:MBOAT family O-acyltransferase [Ascidiimonas sp. W6]|uniref:MBOAT family O-acyltransferase n=1 Tax=Ascidiimonas meishanensis TaxID=3128903 RepID=UPI0030ED3BBA